jgi:tRNA U34 5-methylaminomethyl-2-thiouridine-forming methyltransferase MnmC
MTTPSKLPPLHDLVPTLDGSYTLFSQNFQEACHSTHGAREETLLHYIRGCQVTERCQEFNPFCILEVGFGLGMGFLTTLEQMPHNCRWVFVSFEIDRNLLEWFIEEHPELGARWEENILHASGENFDLFIVQGDARIEGEKFLKKEKRHFHAIYQDAFSPKRNPSLWTTEWFGLLKAVSHPEVILSTYSASTSIRKSLLASGWGVHRGEKFGPKRTSTRATLLRKTDPEILIQMERSGACALTDQGILELPKAGL